VERERDREQRTSGVRDGALDKNGNGVGRKWSLVKKDTFVFLVKQINRTNKLSIKLGGSRILQFHQYINIHSYDDMFHYTNLYSPKHWILVPRLDQRNKAN
jgi:hypothetical protein